MTSRATRTGRKATLTVVFLCGLAGLSLTASGEAAPGPGAATTGAASGQERADAAPSAEPARIQRVRKQYVRTVKLRMRATRDDLDVRRIGKWEPKKRKYVLRLRCRPGLVNCARSMRLGGTDFKRPATLHYRKTRGKTSVWRGSQSAGKLRIGWWYGCGDGEEEGSVRWYAPRFVFTVRLGIKRVWIEKQAILPKFTVERATTSSCGEAWLNDPNARIKINQRPIVAEKGSARLKR